MRTNVKALIKDSRDSLKELMQDQLDSMAVDLVAQVIRTLKASTPAERVNAAKGAAVKGRNAYLADLKEALAVIANAAIEDARREVPKAKKVKLADVESGMRLAEFESLPADIQKRLLAKSQLIVDTQLADLEKAVFFQFSSSVDSTDSDDLIEKDLLIAADDFVTGPSIEAGTATIAADVVNTARNGFFFDDEVLKEIEAFEFVNGDPVSPICQDLAGTIFAKDDPESDRYMPPLHHNCKSYIVPILTGNLGNREIGDLKPSSSDLEKYIRLSEQARCGCQEN